MRRGDMKERETYAKTRVHKEDSVARLPARAPSTVAVPAFGDAARACPPPHWGLARRATWRPGDL